MSMSVRCEGCGLEYAGARGLGGLFAQPHRAGEPGLPAHARSRSSASTAPPGACYAPTATP